MNFFKKISLSLLIIHNSQISFINASSSSKIIRQIPTGSLDNLFHVDGIKEYILEFLINEDMIDEQIEIACQAIENNDYIEFNTTLNLFNFLKLFHDQNHIQDYRDDNNNSFLHKIASIRLKKFSYPKLQNKFNSDQAVMIYRLLQNNIDLDDANNENLTAMHCAAISGNILVIKFLKKYGADINANLIKIKESWEELNDTDNVDSVEEDIKNNIGYTPLHAAIDKQFHNIELVETLVLLGAQVKAPQLYWDSWRHVYDYKIPFEHIQKKLKYSACSEVKKQLETMAQILQNLGGKE